MQEASRGGPDGRRRTRSRILAAALAEFGAHGYRGARIEAIARRARVPRGLIAYYFATKEGLFQALARERAQAIERIEPLVRAGPDDPLAWTLSLFALGNAGVEWVRLLIWEGLEWESPDLFPKASEDAGAFALERERRAFWEGRIAEVRRFQERGQLPAHLDPRHLTFFLYVLGLYPYLGPQITYLITGRWPSDEQFQAEFEGFVRRVAGRLARAGEGRSGAGA
jgi:AcrR family transcriptional regulator